MFVLSVLIGGFLILLRFRDVLRVFKILQNIRFHVPPSVQKPYQNFDEAFFISFNSFNIHDPQLILIIFKQKIIYLTGMFYNK